MYHHLSIEKKWQAFWKKHKTFATPSDSSKRKQYVLDMFPYPSSNGLHVGHPLGYIASDIYSRYLRMNGYAVLHPMGWDAFGLPAENYAIKTGIHPAETTYNSIETFRRQMQMLGFSYDWDREVNTSSPEYYRWTQWLFLQLYHHGLAVKKKAPVNWCESCHTVLAHEQVVGGACERCHAPVIQKKLEQWFFKVTQYAEELLKSLDELDWPEPIKQAQRNWIGRSQGALIPFQLRTANCELRTSIEVFTTRPDTLFGATYLVLAPDHPLVDEFADKSENSKEVRAYQKETRAKNELERLHLEKEKTGVQLKGIFVVNPATKEKIPLWIADYVLSSYGTGAIMAVPAHDSRDFAFAKKYHLPMSIVICPNYPEKTCPVLDEAYEGEGHLVMSGSFDGMPSHEARKALTEYVGGALTTIYKLRDWLVSRQRYWGAPIPLISCSSCGEVAVSAADLPILLPTDVDFKPTGESPLKHSKTFHAVSCPSCNAPARRESDTMDTFVCSSWYYLRYPSPHTATEPFEQKATEYWLPVDLYLGGAEHAVLHLLYARFITKALADMGYVSFREPFTRLRNQGMILGEDGEKMSKSRGNVINPDDVVETYGADTLRLYEMFMGPLEDAKPWSTKGIVGLRRFLEKTWSTLNESRTQNGEEHEDAALERIRHKTVQKVTNDIVTFKFNTALSALMIWMNALTDAHKKGTPLPQNVRETFILLISPFAPHVSEELWEREGHTDSLAFAQWPSYEEEKIREETALFVVQVNGKVRDSFEISLALSEEELKKEALARMAVKKWTEGKKIKKIIIVNGKLANIVTD